jgi:hypothetical protein
VHPRLNHALQAANRLYRQYPGVVGIAAGTKFKNQRRLPGPASIQFFVRKKPKRGLKKTLPRFIWGRSKKGRIDRRFRFQTDVIAVGSTRAACGAGSTLTDFGERGVTTLLFRNRRAGDTQHYYLITCGHVVGRLQSTEPDNRQIESDCCPAAGPFADAILSARQRGGCVAYDIALGRLLPEAGRYCLIEDRRITGESTVLTSFMPRSNIKPGLRVACRFPASGIDQAMVDSYAGWVSVNIHGRELEIGNAFLLRARVRPGDSGGIIFRETQAVGILFARSSEGWAWFHPLREAVDHLNSLDPEVQVKVF